MTDKKLVNIGGESKIVPWTNSKGNPAPSIGGEIISEFFVGTDDEIRAKTAGLSAFHNAPMEVHHIRR